MIIKSKSAEKVTININTIGYSTKEFFIKIKKDYFNLLSNIVNDYYKVNIKWLHNYIAEKIENMWGKSKKYID